MTGPEIAKFLGDSFINLALVGVVAFIVSYGLFFRWSDTAAGRSIMAFATSLVMTSGVSFLVRFIGREPWVEYVRSTGFFFVFLASWGMFFVLWHTRLRGAREIGPHYFTAKEKTMTNNDRIISYIRTGVPALVGMLLTWLVSKVPAVADWLHTIDQALIDLGFIGASVNGLLVAGGTALVVTLYYALSRWLGEKFPWIEKFLLGRSAVPVYLTPEDAKVVEETLPDADSREVSVTFGEHVLVKDADK